MSEHSYAYVRTEDAPSLPPPPSEQGVTGWLWQNVFSSMSNFSTIGASIVSILMALLTIGFGVVLVWIAWTTLDFAVFSATFTDPEGLKGETCKQNGGACWPFIREWLYGFTFGNEYPREEVWRVVVSYIMLALGLVWVLWDGAPYRRYGFIFMLVLYPIIAFVLLNGTPVFGEHTYMSILRAALVPLLIGAVTLVIAKYLQKLDGGGVVSMIAALLLLAIALYCSYRMLNIAYAGLETFNTIRASGDVNLLLVGFFGLVLLALALAAVALPVMVLLFVMFESRAGQLSTAMVGIGPVFVVVGLMVIAYNLVPVIAGGIDAGLGLEVVSTSKWGGLLVTLVVALAGITASLPLGILLALGRQTQNAPIIKWVCIVFIEVVRGIPLISVLFFASAMLPYFLEPGVEFNKLLRALIGVTLFASAYMAEVIRGGLQAMPKGQYEGAQALGLSYWQMMRLIILPQALTTVIPGIVNTFIGLFKDTTLVLIISIFDLLGILQLRALKDIDWYGPFHAPTGYLFVAIVYWVFCFSMSRYSIYMENKLNRSHR